MSINLEKRAAKVGIVLAKRGLTVAPKTRVGVALDVSGSARGFYSSGAIQETLDRLLAVAMKFDDNGELDAWTFDNQVGELPTITAEDEGTYVKNKLLTANVSLWGSTKYAPPLKSAMEFYFGPATLTEKAGGFFGKLFGGSKAPASQSTGDKKDPAMLLFITDGANDDRAEAERVLREAAANSPVYFNMIGIGSENQFTFIKQMADDLPNVGFVSMSTLNISDEELYEKVVSQEFCDWAKRQ